MFAGKLDIAYEHYYTFKKDRTMIASLIIKISTLSIIVKFPITCYRLANPLHTAAQYIIQIISTIAEMTIKYQSLNF
jgi:hypothetical protein